MLEPPSPAWRCRCCSGRDEAFSAGSQRAEVSFVLLREFKYQLFAPECNPNAETLNCLAAFSDDVSAVFPYLNAVLKGCIYRPDAGILSFRYEGSSSRYSHAVSRSREWPTMVTPSARSPGCAV